MQTDVNEQNDETPQKNKLSTEIVTPSPPDTLRSNFNFPRRRKLTRKKTHHRATQANKKQKVAQISLPKRKVNQQLTYSELSYEDTLLDEENENLFNGLSTLRIVIAYYYRCILRAPPECE